MDDVIKGILDSEELAQKIINEARLEKASHDSDITLEIEKYQYKVHKDVWARINKYTEELKSKTSAKVAHIEKAAQDQVIEMKRRAENGKGKWIEQVFGKILGDGGDIG
ncbi:MAG: hypothetical protein FWH55_03340 [Oscillospiraceae bacterium]|nr:hypothetical protein [Oscillospiraceae bacterium]